MLTSFAYDHIYVLLLQLKYCLPSYIEKKQINLKNKIWTTCWNNTKYEIPFSLKWTNIWCYYWGHFKCKCTNTSSFGGKNPKNNKLYELLNLNGPTYPFLVNKSIYQSINYNIFNRTRTFTNINAVREKQHTDKWIIIL
jgi:hypothetical protein